MIQFTPTTAGASALAAATAGTNPVLIDSIVLYNSNTTIKTITDFSGSVVPDDSGIGNYIVIDFDDTSTSAYTITSIRLKSDVTEIAISETISVQKQANKKLKLRVTCQFEGAEKCAFVNTHINLPYATEFRDGVIRFAKSSGETQKDKTVYSAQDVETVINNYIVSSDKYVPWKEDSTSGEPIEGSVVISSLEIVDDIDTPTKTTTITTTSGGKLSIDKVLTGNVVSSSPTISSGAITTSEKVINEAYISSLYANEVSSANNTKLVTSYAVSQYVSSQLSSIDSNYVHMTGAETIAGAKTFSDGVVSTSYTGTGVQSSTTNWNASANNSKLPTVEVVDAALDALETSITTAYQQADTNLQSQIDALNAGQNLADIVDQIADLKSHSVTNLQARGDGSITIGDKIQVLHDKTDSSGTVVPTADGVATVYELVKGTIDTTTYPKDQTSTTSGYYWHYIGEYGSDSYSKSESDAKYVVAASLDQSILSTSSTTNAPSTKAVYDAIAAAPYVKLESATKQTIKSQLDIKASNAATVVLNIPDGKTITSNDSLTIKSDNSTNSISTVYDISNKAFTIKLGSNTLIDLRKTGSGTAVADVSGDLVASYRDSSITSGILSDGRLVTVDYLTHFTGDMSGYAKVNANNDFTNSTTPTTNAFNAITATTITASTSVSSQSYTGTGVYSSYSSGSGTGGWDNASSASKLPTVSSVKSAISDAKSDILSTISTINSIGSIGLFIYSEVGEQKVYGETVNGQYLKPVGISLPMSGQISYKAVASVPAMSGTWKLLSVAFKRTTTDPCLVLAQKISNS